MGELQENVQFCGDSETRVMDMMENMARLTLAQQFLKRESLFHIKPSTPVGNKLEGDPCSNIRHGL